MTSYFYNLDGSVQSITYPSGRSLNYTYTVQNGTIAPFGGLSGTYNGIVAGGFGGIITTNWYNQQLQPCRFAVRTTGLAPSNCTDNAHQGGVLDLRYDFHAGTSDNGNVYKIVNNRDTNGSQNFLYDDLNRILQAYTDGNSPLPTSWGETFSPTATAPGVAPTTLGIDAWGNLTNRSAVTGKTNTEPLNCAAANTNNQLNTCVGHDAAGNMTGFGTVTYTYNQENQMTKVRGRGHRPVHL